MYGADMKNQKSLIHIAKVSKCGFLDRGKCSVSLYFCIEISIPRNFNCLVIRQKCFGNAHG